MDLEAWGPHLEPDDEACSQWSGSAILDSDEAQREGGWKPCALPRSGDQTGFAKGVSIIPGCPHPRSP